MSIAHNFSGEKRGWESLVQNDPGGTVGIAVAAATRENQRAGDTTIYTE
jgi:hypothetical protein